MNFQRQKILYKKEMLDLFRDKKTIVMMFLIPLVVYPVMAILGLLIGSSILKDQTESTYRVCLLHMENTQAESLRDFNSSHTSNIRFVNYRPSAGSILGSATGPATGSATGSATSSAIDQPHSSDSATSTLKDSDIQSVMDDGSFDAVVTLSADQQYVISYYQADTSSSNAANATEKVLEAFKKEAGKQALIQAGMDAEAILNPFQIQRKNLSSNEKTMGSFLGTILPLILIIGIMVGAFYPAVDMTTGEKERGTLETLLSFPVSNLDIVISKYLATATISVISAVLNLLSMGIIGFFLLQNAQAASKTLSIHLATFLPALFLVLLCVVAFALFLSAISLGICTMASSFKEAENYLTPLLLVVMAIGYMGMLPNLKLSAPFSLIPVVNMVLLVKDLFSFSYEYLYIFLVLITNIFYGFLSILFVSRIYNTEDILFNTSKGLKLMAFRSNMKPKQMPNLGDAILLLTVCFLTMFYTSYFITKLGLIGNGVSQLFYLVFSVLYAWYMKADFKKLFSLRRFTLKELGASFLIWLGGFFLAMNASVIFTGLFPSAAGHSEEMARLITSLSFPMALIFAALVPAICEEVLFRGFLFGTLKNQTSTWIAILVSAGIFGLYHMNLIQSFVVMILGILSAYVVYKTRSIYLGIFMHLCNNSMAVILTYFPKLSDHLPAFLSEESFSILPFFLRTILGTGLLVLGIFVLKKSIDSKKRTGYNRRNNEEKPT